MKRINYLISPHETISWQVICVLNYLEVLFVRHLQGDYVSTTGAVTVTTRASDGADDTVFDTPEEAGDSRFDIGFETADSSKRDGHFIRFPISFFGTAWNISLITLTSVHNQNWNEVPIYN